MRAGLDMNSQEVSVEISTEEKQPEDDPLWAYKRPFDAFAPRKDMTSGIRGPVKQHYVLVRAGMNQRIVQTLPIHEASEVELCNDGSLKLGLLVRSSASTNLITVLSNGLFFEFDLPTGRFLQKSRGFFTPLRLRDTKQRA